MAFVYRGSFYPLFRRSSCAPVSRWRQGQALRVLRNLDPAGRGRMIKTAGSGNAAFAPPRELLLSAFFGGPGRGVLLLFAALKKLERITVPKRTIEELSHQYACQLGYDDYPATDSCPYSRLKSAGLYTSYWKWMGYCRRRVLA